MTVERQCKICQGELSLYGPFWIEDLHDEDFIESLSLELINRYSYLKYGERVQMTLSIIKEELPLKKQIFSYNYSVLARDIHLSCPKLSIFRYFTCNKRGALDSLGFKMVQTYYDPNLIKTDCPPSILYQILCQYKKEFYETQYLSNAKEDEFAFRILSKEITIKPKFVELELVNKNLKYLENPLPNWGPKARAKLNK